MKKIFYILIAIFMITSLGYAAPNIYGSSGLIEMPTAESLQYKEFNVGLDYSVKSEATPSSNNGVYYYKLNLGSFKGFELGIVGGTIPTEGVFVNLKYYLMSDNSRYPISIAIGMEKLTSHTDSSAYLVASKKFQEGFHGHFGFKAHFLGAEIDSSIMLGLEYLLSDEFSIETDILNLGNQYRINSGVRYYFSDNIFFRASILDITNARGEGMLYNVGVSWTRFL
ncbi:hypothetical protein HOC37_00545 [bacterium]|jgi:hypothetical protein|nr:hypothetical protein [bacterium]MBT4551453.1 hypothetical protein [bacterium]